MPPVLEVFGWKAQKLAKPKINIKTKINSDYRSTEDISYSSFS